MNAQPPVAISLTPTENALLSQISFEDTRHDVLVKSCKAAKTLTLSLLKRDAVPQVRLDYFTNPQYFIGGHGKSRVQIFESNGTRGDDIFDDGNFLKYLRHWILGPILPKDTIAGFCAILNHEIGTSGMELDRRCKYVREQTRNHNLQMHVAAEEFYKLALELGLHENTSRSIRDAVMSTR